MSGGNARLGREADSIYVERASLEIDFRCSGRLDHPRLALTPERREKDKTRGASDSSRQDASVSVLARMRFCGDLASGASPAVVLSFMKQVFSSPDPARVALVQSLLDTESIRYELRNQAVSQAEAGMPFSPELWVLHDEDYAKARELIESCEASA